jgi:hypothetical protein
LLSLGHGTDTVGVVEVEEEVFEESDVLVEVERVDVVNSTVEAGDPVVVTRAVLLGSAAVSVRIVFNVKP